jgi:hypothetical protein
MQGSDNHSSRCELRREQSGIHPTERHLKFRLVLGTPHLGGEFGKRLRGKLLKAVAMAAFTKPQKIVDALEARNLMSLKKLATFSNERPPSLLLMPGIEMNGSFDNNLTCILYDPTNVLLDNSTDAETDAFESPYACKNC